MTDDPTARRAAACFWSRIRDQRGSRFARVAGRRSGRAAVAPPTCVLTSRSKNRSTSQLERRSISPRRCARFGRDRRPATARRGGELVELAGGEASGSSRTDRRGSSAYPLAGLRAGSGGGSSSTLGILHRRGAGVEGRRRPRPPGASRAAWPAPAPRRLMPAASSASSACSDVAPAGGGGMTRSSSRVCGQSRSPLVDVAWPGGHRAAPPGPGPRGVVAPAGAVAIGDATLTRARRGDRAGREPSGRIVGAVCRLPSGSPAAGDRPDRSHDDARRHLAKDQARRDPDRVTFKDAAEKVLRDADGPMKVKAIAELAIPLVTPGRPARRRPRPSARTWSSTRTRAAGSSRPRRHVRRPRDQPARRRQAAPQRS